jgi:pimeloyl-ACP methyl ester carboxylesterase
MSDVRAISFKNRAGLTLFGSLHLPTQPRPDLPHVVLLSPGVKMRVGPGRLYVPLTDLLVSLGYPVLRFDFYGLGDSEGDLAETVLADVYNNIEVGRYVDDTLAALAWLEQEQGARKFILGGLCGGAITAILAAERHARVEGLLSIGMTVTLASNAATPAAYLTSAQVDQRRAGYVRRLLQPKSWIRFLTFRSEYGVIWRVVKRMFVKEPPKPAPAATTSPAAIEQRGNANPLFPRAYFNFLKRGGRALMLFSERDRLQSEYEEKFAQPFAAQLQAHLPQIEQHVIAHANHVLSFREWQQEMLTLTRAWLGRVS